MIIGFGRCEQGVATAIIQACRVDGIEPVQSSYAAQASLNDEMPRQDAPERYTQFWAHEHTSPCGDRIRRFTMHHTNRRHALSPDGWALLVTLWVEIVERDGDVHVFKEC